MRQREEADAPDERSRKRSRRNSRFISHTRTSQVTNHTNPALIPWFRVRWSKCIFSHCVQSLTPKPDPALLLINARSLEMPLAVTECRSIGTPCRSRSRSKEKDARDTKGGRHREDHKERDKRDKDDANDRKAKEAPSRDRRPDARDGRREGEDRDRARERERDRERDREREKEKDREREKEKDREREKDREKERERLRIRERDRERERERDRRERETRTRSEPSRDRYGKLMGGSLSKQARHLQLQFCVVIG